MKQAFTISPHIMVDFTNFTLTPVNGPDDIPMGEWFTWGICHVAYRRGIEAGVYLNGRDPPQFTKPFSIHPPKVGDLKLVTFCLKDNSKLLLEDYL